MQRDEMKCSEKDQNLLKLLSLKLQKSGNEFKGKEEEIDKIKCLMVKKNLQQRESKKKAWDAMKYRERSKTLLKNSS